MKTSARERIMTRLKEGPVCGTDLLREYIPRYAARIHELRQAGHTIVTETCTQHEHEWRQVQYRLVTNVPSGRLF